MLELENVSAQYGEIKILHDVSIRVKREQIVSLVGSNGAGKSTLLHIISGLLKPTCGNIRVDGVDITGLPSHKIVEMGVVLVPEGKLLFSKMSVRENLLVGSVTRHAKLNREKFLKQIFEIFPVLYNRMNQLAGSLSGGEQQMLAIGRGLMSNPKLIILDEVSLGLAPLLIKQIFGILSALRKDGLSILLVDQNLVQTLEITDFTYILTNGRIVFGGISDKLITDEQIRHLYLGL